MPRQEQTAYTGTTRNLENEVLSLERPPRWGQLRRLNFDEMFSPSVIALTSAMFTAGAQIWMDNPNIPVWAYKASAGLGLAQAVLASLSYVRRRTKNWER